jgi:lipid A ethanolaminephosphotransferase
MKSLFKNQPWHPTNLLMVLALWLSLAGNLPMWLTVWQLPESQGFKALTTLGSLILILLSMVSWLLLFLVWPKWLKPAGLVFMAVVTSSSYFMLTYNVVIDPSMIANVLHTDAREVRDLLSWRMLAALLLGVVLPGIWWWRQPVRQLSFKGVFLRQLVLFAMAWVMMFVFVWASFQDLASLMRNHTSLRYMANPFNSLYAVTRLFVGQASQAAKPLQAIGEDAKLLSMPASEKEAPLIVLVVGETVRAANFGLSGYARQTTPELHKLKSEGDLVYFSDVSSCGTSTQTSLPCMFSHLGKTAYENSDQPYEGLLDVLQRAGLAVLWIDNQSGCKGVCDRVSQWATQTLKVPELCQDGECFDEIMLQELPKQLSLLDPARRAKGTVVVMHQMGSHGPAYYKRTPEAFKQFKPECKSSALQNCPADQIANAYDNSVLYADHFVSKTVKWLQAQSRPTALMYLSDHGESLGEKGLYLHGMPYRMAPREQTHVPMLAWLSKPMQAQRGWRMACLQGQADKPWSHDNLFHSVLGLSQVATGLAKPELDIFAACAPGR